MRGSVPVAVACLSFLSCLLSGCAERYAVPRAWVAGNIEERTGYPVSQEGRPPKPVVPPTVSWEDGIDEEEAVSLALWNNAAFQELMVDADVARGDVLLAGQIPNPEFWIVNLDNTLINAFRFWFEAPVDWVYLRPIRLKAAGFESRRVSQRLVQDGLNLIRDVRQSYADVVAARERIGLADEQLRIRKRTAELAEIRRKNGDATPLEAGTAQMEALRAREERERAGYDLAIVEEQLKNLLGIGCVTLPVQFTNASPLPEVPEDVMPVLDDALQHRPDALAAHEATEAAKYRLRLERVNWFKFNIIVFSDGYGDKPPGVFEIGPGVRVNIPIFNHNQGGIARAKAFVDRALHTEATLRDRICLEVRQAHLRWVQARTLLQMWEKDMRPLAEQNIQRAEKAYKEGEASLLLVLETTRQMLDVRAREIQLSNDLRRARAELERSVGHSLASTWPAGGACPR
jgi:cobalt-zinc-cadmium efflux system outer membrane protein